jgi:hypothetical protein
MNDYDYRFQMLVDTWIEEIEEVRQVGREFMAMSQDYIIIHRPDKLSPKKKVKNFRFE